MSLAGTIRVSSNFTNTKDGVDLSTPSEIVAHFLSKTIDTGVLYHDTISLSALEVKILDFGDNSLSDVFGATIAMSGVTSLYVKTDSGNTSNVTISGGVNSFLNDMPTLAGGEGIGFGADINISTNSKLYLINGAVSGAVDIIVSGDE